MGDVFKELVWPALIKAGLGLLFKAVPWLGFGPIGVVVGWVVGIFAEKLYEVISESVNLQVIAFKNDKARAAFDRASVELHIIAKGKGLDSEEYRLAREKHKAALQEFVRFGVSA